uniref:Uncharacterized protein n=1 Tax=Anguilla anguilla TaxID=7936 RepID=A0A0E9WJ62_ANGAN
MLFKCEKVVVYQVKFSLSRQQVLFSDNFMYQFPNWSWSL